MSEPSATDASPADSSAVEASDASAAPVRWLTDDEMAAWLPLTWVSERLPQALDRQLRESAGVSHMYYQILAMLSAAPDTRLPMTELARVTASSPSRLSHAVGVLESKGLVVRETCSDDRRVQYATLTSAGTAFLVKHAPGHVAEVRKRVFDHLDEDDVAHLRRIAEKLARSLGQ